MPFTSNNTSTVLLLPFTLLIFNSVLRNFISLILVFNNLSKNSFNKNVFWILQNVALKTLSFFPL